LIPSLDKIIDLAAGCLAIEIKMPIEDDLMTDEDLLRKLRVEMSNKTDFGFVDDPLPASSKMSASFDWNFWLPVALIGFVVVRLFWWMGRSGKDR
jgi:hypothetical protein